MSKPIHRCSVSFSNEGVSCSNPISQGFHLRQDTTFHLLIGEFSSLHLFKVPRYPAIKNNTFSCFISIDTLCLCAVSLCFLAACRQSGRGFTVTDSHRAERHRRVDSLGHYEFKASFTDGLCGVSGLVLTVGSVRLLLQKASGGLFNSPMWFHTSLYINTTFTLGT